MTVIIGLIGREGACLGAAEPLLQGAKEITFFAAPAIVDHIVALDQSGVLGQLLGSSVPRQTVVSARSGSIGVAIAVEAVVVVVATAIGR